MTLLEIEGKLPNGQIIKPGDVVHVDYWGYQRFSKVWEENGCLMINGAGAFSFASEAYHFINQGGELKKVSPKDVYLFCKKYGWDTKKALALFK